MHKAFKITGFLLKMNRNNLFKPHPLHHAIAPFPQIETEIKRILGNQLLPEDNLPEDDGLKSHNGHNPMVTFFQAVPIGMSKELCVCKTPMHFNGCVGAGEMAMGLCLQFAKFLREVSFILFFHNTK